MKKCHYFCPLVVLVMVGAINWGLVGLGGFFNTNLNVVNLLLGSMPTLENIVYLAVGVAGILVCFKHISKKTCDS